MKISEIREKVLKIINDLQELGLTDIQILDFFDDIIEINKKKVNNNFKINNNENNHNSNRQRLQI
jgi:DNA-binding MltR family transcriptional regulator